MAKFSIGDTVRKIKGSKWQGVVVGVYSTDLTPEGYAVESSTEKGSVQIYPAAALELAPCNQLHDAYLYGWKQVDPRDRTTWPQESGDYYVKIAGDSESCDGQTLYEYPDYTALMRFDVFVEEGEHCVVGTGPHDEEFNEGYGVVEYAKIPAAKYTPLRNLDTEPEEPKGQFFLNLPK